MPCLSRGEPHPYVPQVPFKFPREVVQMLTGIKSMFLRSSERQLDLVFEPSFPVFKLVGSPDGEDEESDDDDW